MLQQATKQVGYGNYVAENNRDKKFPNTFHKQNQKDEEC